MEAGMNLKRLQAFRAVFDTGSVTRAAQRLHTTQPAVSRLIRDLETELGLTLFLRKQQRLVPTAEGIAFFREAERALAAVDQIVDIARDIRTLKGAHLRVVAGMVAAFGIMPAATKALLASHPRVHVTLEIKDVRDIADWVATGPFDVGITRMPLQDARVECEPLLTGRCVLVMRPDHPLARKRVVSIAELAGERMVQTSQGNIHRELVAGAFASAGIPYAGSVDTPTGLSACQFVARGLGLAIMDPYAFRAAEGFGIVARPLRPALEFSLGFFFPAARPRSNLVKAFVQATRTAVASLEADGVKDISAAKTGSAR
jgi:DNA-binding transcriptional LysR family regulator